MCDAIGVLALVLGRDHGFAALVAGVAAVAAAATACDQNISADADTSCDFASNTFYEYWQATSGDLTPGEQSVEVWSPATRQNYTQICTNNGNEVDCTHNNGDEVQFSAASVMAYTQPEANTYAASGNLEP